VGRRARRRASQEEGATQPQAAPQRAAPSRSETKNAAARARLVPLAEGERPRAVTVGAIVAALFGALNAGLWLAGLDIRGQRPSVLALVFSLLLLVTAWGMWRARYWAVLAFQVLLALTLISVAVPVITSANSIQALVFVAVVLVPGGGLFWFLVKAMARIQMPERR
jgi:hypothetical protein